MKEQVKMIMPIILIVCGIILVMNSFMPRIAVIAAVGIGTPIFIYTILNLIKKGE